MSTIISVIILVLSMLIMAILQLIPGTFAIFYHYVLGKKGHKKAGDFGLSFILGTEIFVALIWTIFYIIIFSIFKNSTEFCTSIFFWIMFGIFIAEAIASLLLYYRHGKNTKLFIPRRVADSLITHAQKIRTRSDAFALGFFAGLPELIFTIPLYIISATILLETSTLPRGVFVVFYILSATIPLFITLCAFCLGHNLANIQRFRLRSKTFFRLLICVCFILLAIAILNLGVI